METSFISMRTICIIGLEMAKSPNPKLVPQTLVIQKLAIAVQRESSWL